MSTYENVKVVNLVAGENLDGDLYEALTIDSDGRVVKTTAATNVIVGVLAEDPGRTTVDGVDTVPVALLQGIILVKAGASFNAGTIVVSHGATTAGTVTAVANTGALAADQMGIGIALEAGAAGKIIRVLAMPIAAPHSA